MEQCYCKSGKTFSLCCQPYIEGRQTAPSPEELMRSRFSAYATANAEYIYNTYAASSQKEQTLESIQQFADSCQFVHLEVLSHFTHADNQTGKVHFIAHYLYRDLHIQLEEESNFVYEDLQWLYLDGNLIPHEDIKLKRNDPCPCLSGKKYKKCHGR